MKTTSNGVAVRPEARIAMSGPQAVFEDAFKATGFTLQRAAEVITEIACGTPTLEQVVNKDGEVVVVEKRPSSGDRLRAVDLRVRLTTGYAPTRAVNVNANVDGMFDEKAFSNPPPITVDATVE